MILWLGIGAAIVLLVLFLWIFDFVWYFERKRDPYDEIDC